MTKQIKFSYRKLAELRRLIGEVRGIKDHRRLFCIWIKALADLPAGKIAKMLLLQTQTVRQVQSQYRAKGGTALLCRGKGGRKRFNLSLQDETRLLRASATRVHRNGRKIVDVHELLRNYTNRISARGVVPRSTIYRLLKRHGCRRIEKGRYLLPKELCI